MTETKKKTSVIAILIKAVALCFVGFHIWTAFNGPYYTLIQRGVHVLGALLLFYLSEFDKHKGKVWLKILDVLLAFCVVIPCTYASTQWKNFIKPNFSPTVYELIIAIMMIIAIFEACRRTIGPAIPILSLIAVLYALFGKYFPGRWRHNGVAFDYLIHRIFYSDGGIFGSITGTSATVLVMFIIFGAVLFATGGGKAFMDLSMALAGNTVGGAAKLSVVASGLFGMISGSANANVATTGAFTIPMMKKLGYSDDFAAATESAASSGGQIMPPIMGSAAFIMAEIVGVPYLDVCKAAIIPSILFYLGVIFAVDCKARREGFKGIPKEEIPKLKEVLAPKRSLSVFVPLIVLITFFVLGYSPVTCAIRAIIAAVVFYLATNIKDLKTCGKTLVNAFIQAAKDMPGIVALITCAQILLTVIELTGVGIKFTNIVINLGGNNLLLAGLFAMFAVMLIGMGLPTVGAYMLTASVIAPALTSLGVNTIAAHFFCMYFAVFSGLTPPVCATVFVAAAMAKSNWLKTASIAMRLSIGAYIVPFSFLMSSALLLIGRPGEITLSILFAVIGVISVSGGSMGFIATRLNMVHRIAFIIAGLLMVYPSTITSIIGLIVFAVSFALALLLYFKRKGRIENKEAENDDSLIESGLYDLHQV